jgi:hypothetical protein
MLGMRLKRVLTWFAVLVLLAVFWLLSRHSASSPRRAGSATAPAASETAPAAPASAEVRRSARDVPVPASCTPDVNQKLAGLLAQQTRENVDNVMVCGVTISASRTQRGGEHGSHQVLPLMVNLPGGGSKLVEVVTNDELDGVVTAPKDAQVFAYGQAFLPEHGRFAAGIHDVHCATHRTADNGWVVVNGRKFPASCTSAQTR